MKKTSLALCLLALMSTGSVQAAEWGYSGQHGPAYWGNVSATCADGKNQSPIDISGAVDADLKDLEITYQGNVTALTNNGHTLQAELSGDNTLSLDGTTYKLQQFHFHTPSENLIRGKQYPLEAHFVHADRSGNLAVLAVMFDNGAENPQMTQLTDTLPGKGETVKLNPSFPVASLLPKLAHYYRFNGSLTTPPCSEGVRWLVVKQPQQLAGEQTQQLMDVMGHNNRPVQAKNARVVLKND